MAYADMGIILYRGKLDISPHPEEFTADGNREEEEEEEGRPTAVFFGCLSHRPGSY